MALTEEDKKRLSVPQKASILSATAAWDKAHAAGDTAGMSAAAEAARKIRENAGYYTDSAGNFAGQISSIPTTAAPSGSSRSKLMSAQQLADKYGGINFDEDAILRKFNAATRAEYDLLRKEYGNVENQFGKKLSDIQGTALDTIRKANAAAIATGASRGVQAANELSAMLGLQNESALMATELAQQRQQLADKEAAALARNPVEALTAANAEKQKLATLAANIYAQDTMFDVGELDAQTKLMTAQKQFEGLKYQADMSKIVQELVGQNMLDQKQADIIMEMIRAQATVDAAELNKLGMWGYGKDAAEINSKNSGRNNSSGGNMLADVKKTYEYDKLSTDYAWRMYNDAYARGNLEEAAYWKTMTSKTDTPDMASAIERLLSDELFMSNKIKAAEQRPEWQSRRY